MHSRKVLDLLIEGIQIIDFDWRYLYVNEALAAYQNTSREAIIGKTIFERFPAVENSEIFKISQRCMLEREEQIAESDFEYPDKTKKRFELKIKPIEEGIIILSVDITHRYEAETKIKRANHLYNFISELNHKIVKVKDQ
ncbi:MAG: PAS domain-containing protein [Opitutaceae bacterium]|nr:PAS domain-containing protein [Cytophagales bacterium]